MKDETAPRTGDATDVGNKIIHVVYLDHCARLSGAELALLRLVPALDNVKATVILGEDGPLRDKLLSAGIEVELLPLGGVAGNVRRAQVNIRRLPLSSLFATLIYIGKLAHRLRQLKPDIVHSNSLKASVYGSIAAKLAGVPLVWHMRDRLASDYLPSSAVRLTHWMIRTFPSAIVANSLSTLETAGLSGVKGAVIPSPVIYDPVMSHSPLDQRGRSCFVVGIVGRLAEWKGQDVFLRAFAMAFPDGDEQALVVGSAMFGEDAFADHLMRLASQLGIAERVSFTGFTDDVTSKLADMDVLVHASVVAEPFGQVIVEGMVCGLPVVATRGGGPSEIIEDGVTGLLYEPGNDEELARILLQLEGAPQLRQQLGQAAMREAVRYRPSTIAAQMEEVYRCVMNRPKP